MRNSVATKDHRGKAASDNREKKTGCDSVLHPEDPQSKIAPASQTSVMTKQGHIKLVSVPPTVTVERPKGADVFRRLSCMSRGDFTSSSGCPLMNQTSA